MSRMKKGLIHFSLGFFLSSVVLVFVDEFIDSESDHNKEVISSDRTDIYEQEKTVRAKEFSLSLPDCVATDDMLLRTVYITKKYRNGCHSDNMTMHYAFSGDTEEVVKKFYICIPKDFRFDMVEVVDIPDKCNITVQGIK